MANKDLEINFPNSTIQEVCEMIVKQNCREPSREVFDREYLKSKNIYEALGKAMFNETVTIAIEAGRDMDMAMRETEEEKSDESRASE